MEETMRPEDLPTENDAIQKLALEFERLEPDSPKGCPCSLADIRGYLSADPSTARKDLFFGRTARIGSMKFWLWGYVADAMTFFVTVEQDERGLSIASGLGDGLTPEQYLGLRYARRRASRQR